MNVINEIEKEKPLPEELFYKIFDEIEDEAERKKFIDRARKKCEEEEKLQEFEESLIYFEEEYKELQKKNAVAAELNITEFTDAPIVLNCGSWSATENGVKLIKEDRKTVLACSHPILISGRMKNSETGHEKIMLDFKRNKNKWESITIDNSDWNTPSKIVKLADKGINVTSENAKGLIQYLQDLLNINPDKIPLYESVSQLGWANNGFCPYAENIKCENGENFGYLDKEIKPVGNREKWYEIVKELRKNLVTRLIIDASLCSVLIEPLHGLPFIFHLWGETGAGKTVSLEIAMSVWGNPASGKLVRSLLTTHNALPATAGFLKNIPVGGEELQLAKEQFHNFDKWIMELTSQQDKGRSTAEGGLRRSNDWHNCFIFTGEEPITKSNSGGGAKNRVIEVEAEKGLYADVARIKDTVRNNYGWAGFDFVKLLQTSIENGSWRGIKTRHKQYYNAIMRECDTTEKQANSMAFILVADELCSVDVFDESKPLEVKDIKKYLLSEKEVDIAERAYQEFCSWAELKKNNFAQIGVGGVTLPEIYGEENEEEWRINKTAFAKFAEERGMDATAVITKWGKRGYINQNAQGRNSHSTSVKGLQGTYYFIKKPHALE